MKGFCTKRVVHAALPVLLATICLLAAGRAEVIDRIVAKVNGQIILQSDWDDALHYEALLSGRSLDQFTEEDKRAVLDRLIDQELLDEQMKSASFQHASQAEAEARIAEAKKLYPAAATPEGWQSVLSRFQLTEKDLVEHVKLQIDLMRLVDARLRPQVQIDSNSIEAYYRDKFVPQLKQEGGSDVALADVSSKIRELLTDEKVNELLVSWLHNLRSESKVIIADAAGSGSGGVESQ
jgi:peptidyl-prolyl cis-trans isomerase SurA